MNYIPQPIKSYCCGQCCVAMAAGVDLDEAFQAVGKKGATSTKALAKALKHYGINGQKTKLTPIRGDLSRLPETAILKVKLAWKKRNWHWVLKHGGKIFDHGKHGVIPIGDFAKIRSREITSYLEVNA